MAEFRKFRKFIDNIERDKEVRKSKEENSVCNQKKSSLNRFIVIDCGLQFHRQNEFKGFLEEYFKDPEKTRWIRCVAVVKTRMSNFIRFTRERIEERTEDA